MATYIDPTDDAWPHPSLIGDLTPKRSTDSRAREEDQLTVAIAWLLDRWPNFAREFSRLCFTGDAEGQAALERARAFGARTWVTLPGLAGTTARNMYPDVSVAGNGGEFEILIEVKVGADPHSYEIWDDPQTKTGLVETIWQHEAYARSWAGCEQPQARVQRVVMLSTTPMSEGAVPAGLSAARHVFRTRELLWSDVEALVSRLRAEDDSMDATLQTIALEFHQALLEHALGVTSMPSAELLEWGRDVLAELVPRLAERFAADPRAPRLQKSYSSAYLQLKDAEQARMDVWLYVTGSGAEYSVGTSPDAFFVAAFEGKAKWTPAAHQVLVESGAHRGIKDAAGFKLTRRWWPASELRAFGDAESAADHLYAQLEPIFERLTLSRRPA